MIHLKNYFLVFSNIHESKSNSKGVSSTRGDSYRIFVELCKNSKYFTPYLQGGLGINSSRSTTQVVHSLSCIHKRVFGIGIVLTMGILDFTD